MAVRIRLRRMGAKKVPFYRIVVADAKAPLKGKFIESLGWYDPKAKKARVNKEKVLEWIGKGAQLTNSVEKLLVNYSLISKEEISKKRGVNGGSVQIKPKGGGKNA